MKKTNVLILLIAMLATAFSFNQAHAVQTITRTGGGSNESIRVSLWNPPPATNPSYQIFAYSGSDQSLNFTFTTGVNSLIYFRDNSGVDITPLTGARIVDISSNAASPTVFSKSYVSGPNAGTTLFVKVYQSAGVLIFRADRFAGGF